MRHTFSGRLMLLRAAASRGADSRYCCPDALYLLACGFQLQSIYRAAPAQVRSACQLPPRGSDRGARARPIRKPVLIPRLYRRVKRTSLFGALRTTSTR